ncbi:MAG: DNA polymerase III subunit beta [Sedimentisphaerales bacterium]|nr:DNA polymerase III subunit beta [Sedimentisphaerales bacterium]
MKVQFNREALSQALALLTTIVPERTPKPILRCVKIDAGKDSVRIYGTDLEVGVNCLIAAADVKQEGQVVVPAGRLAAVVRESADETLLIEASEGKCEVKGADSHFSIYGQEASQYPTVPTFEDGADIELLLNTLRTGILQCLFATAKESTRYAINGILWEMKGKKLTLVATDGRRLARCRVNLTANPSEKASATKIIVPAKTMSLLEKLTGSEKDKVMVRLVDNQIMFACGDVVISSNLVDGNFPKYEDIIPSDYQKKLTLPTAVALSAVKRAALLTSEESRGIKLAISKNKLVFSGRAPETGDAEVDVVVEYAGEPIEIGFNPQFLTDAIRVIQEPQFELELGQPDTPGVIKAGANFLYVVMPINLS